MNVSRWLIVVFCTIFLSGGSVACADELLDFMNLIDRLTAEEAKQNYDEAFRLGDRALKMANASPQLRGSAFEVVALAQVGLLHFTQGNLTQAEQQMRRALDVTEKLPPQAQVVPLDFLMTPLLMALARIYQNAGLFTESIPVARRAVALTEKSPDAAGFRVACITTLGDAYSGLGRYAEAEHYHRQAVALCEQKPNDLQYVALFGLANDYSQQFRPEEALALIERGQRLLEKSGRQNTLEGATGFQRLAGAYLSLPRLDDAERAALKALDVATQLGPQAWSINSEIRGTLAGINLARGQAGKAHEQFRQIIAEANSPGNHNQQMAIGATLQLALLSVGEKRWAEAREHVTDAIRRLEQQKGETAQLAMSHVLRGFIEAEMTGKIEAGIPAFERGFEVFTNIRTNSSGDPFDVANSMASYQFLMDALPLSHAATGNPAKTFELLEMSRARGLLGQMRSQGLGWLAGVPKEESERLMKREKSARIRVAESAQKLSMLELDKTKTEVERQRRRGELETELTAAQKNLVESHRDMYNASRVFRLTENSNLSSVSLTDLQAYLAERKALLLHYTINPTMGTVMVIGPSGPPSITGLMLSDEQKQELNMVSQTRVAGIVTAIPESDVMTVTAANLQSALMTAKADGILQLLARPSPPPELTKKLQVLADVLLPGSLKQAVQSDKIQQLIIVPDGPLSLLPFEVLVLNDNEEPSYLLDVAAPITYAPRPRCYGTYTGRKRTQPPSQ